MRFEFNDIGEKQLVELLSTDEKFAAHSRLAEYYLTEERIDEGIALYKKILEEGDLNLLAKSVQVVEFHEGSKYVYELIKKRNAQFLNESEFLSLSCELATRAGDNDEAASLALRIVRQAKSYTAIKNAIKNAIYTLDKTKRVDEALEVIKAEKQPAIVCLKAEIWAFKNDLNKAEEILEPGVVEQRQIETYIWVEILQRNRQFKKAKEALYGLYLSLIHI